MRVLDNPGPERKLSKTTTLSYSYQYSTTSPDDLDWVFRYEYEVEPLDPGANYPAGHLHVNAEPRNYTRIETLKDFPKLHLPTRRVSLEEITWHLINEHTLDVDSADKGKWFELLNDSKAGYGEKMTAKRGPNRPPLLEG